MSQQETAVNSAWLSNPSIIEHLKVQRCGWRVKRLGWPCGCCKRRQEEGQFQHVSVVTCEDCQSCFMHYFSQESGIHSQREVYILSLPFLMWITCDLKHCFASYGLHFFDEKGVTKIHFIIKCYIPKARAICCSEGANFSSVLKGLFQECTHTHRPADTHIHTHPLRVQKHTPSWESHLTLDQSIDQSPSSEDAIINNLRGGRGGILLVSVLSFIC